MTLFFFSLGVGLFLAAATVFFRDIMHIWSVFITALLYFSAIFYDPTQMTFSIGGFNMQQIIKLNPMYWYITGFRRTLMWGIPLDINMFLVCGLCASSRCWWASRCSARHRTASCCIYKKEERTMEPIIKVDNVSMCFNLSTEKHESLKEYLLAMVQGRLQYDEFYALRDVSLDIMPGDFYGLVGLNGSGKSTLLKTIAGVYKPSKGKVTVNGTIAPLIELVRASTWI